MSVTPVGGNVKELCTAAAAGNVELMKYHLHTGMDPNYQHPEFMTTPLVEAARFGHVEAVQMLLQFGADPTIPASWENCTPLQTALEEKQHAVVDALLSHASSSIKDGEKQEEATKGLIVVGMTVSWSALPKQSTKDLDFVAHALSLGHAVVLDYRGGDQDDFAWWRLQIEQLSRDIGNLKIWAPDNVPDFLLGAQSDDKTWTPSTVHAWIVPTSSFQGDSTTTLEQEIKGMMAWPFHGKVQKILLLDDNTLNVGDLDPIFDNKEVIVDPKDETIRQVMIVVKPWWYNTLWYSVRREATCGKLWGCLLQLLSSDSSSNKGIANKGITTCRL